MRRDEELEATIVAKQCAVAPLLDERSRRRWAAAESAAIGYGGDALVSSATGLARKMLRKGRREIARGEPPTSRIPAPRRRRTPGPATPGRRPRRDARKSSTVDGDIRRMRAIARPLNAASRILRTDNLLLASVHPLESPEGRTAGGLSRAAQLRCGRSIPTGVSDRSPSESVIGLDRSQ